MPEASIRFPIGISDFRTMREGGFAYVDKATSRKATPKKATPRKAMPGKAAPQRRR